MKAVEWDKCYVCGCISDRLWMTYPYLGDKTLGVKLCPEHYTMYVERHDDFIAQFGKKKGHK